MTDVKKYLSQIRRYDSRINAKIEERDRLKAMLTKITPTLRDVPSSGSGGQDKLSDAVAKLIDLEAEINREIDSLVDARKSVVGTIDKVTDTQMHEVLCKRYIAFKTWEQIAFEIGKSYQWTWSIHGKALQAVEEILKKSDKNCSS